MEYTMARVSVEDCLKKMPNRFELVMVAADRTRQLMENGEALLNVKNKHAVTALREIAEGLVFTKTEEEPPPAPKPLEPVRIDPANVVI